MSARILLVATAGTSDLGRLGSELQRRNFAVEICSPESAAEKLSENHAADVIVFDARDRQRFTRLAERAALPDTLRVRPGTCPPVALLICDRSDASCETLMRYGHLVFAPLEPGRFANRIVALLRQAVLEREIDRRQRAAKKLGLHYEIAPDQPSKAARLLVIGAGRNFLKLQTATFGFATLCGALTISAALDRLAGEEMFDTLVIDTGIAYEDAIAFIADLRRNPRHIHLPVVMMRDRRMLFGITDALAAGMNEILPSDIPVADVAVHLAIHAGIYRAERTLRQTARLAHSFDLRDEATGLLDNRFLAAFLNTESRDRRADHTDHLIEVEVAIPSGPDCHAVDRDRIMRQIGRLVEKMVRAECLVARAGNEAIAIVVPSSTRREAEAACSRINAILQMTRLSSADDAPPPEITTRIHGYRYRKSA